MIHELTGHECLVEKPDEWPLPKEFTVRVFQDDGDINWYAEISGFVGGEKVEWFTGDVSPARAMAMAADIVKLVWNECIPKNDERKPRMGHCYCRDVVRGTGDPDDSGPTRSLECCRCSFVVPLSDCTL